MRTGFKLMAISMVLSLCGIAQAASEAEEIVTMGDEIQAPPKSSSAVRTKSVQTAERRGDWRFPVGLTFVSGMRDMLDFAEDEMDADADLYVPIGLSFAPYYEFAHGSRIGFDLGPGTIIMIEEQYGDSADTLYWGVPVALTYGFTFIPRASVSPYARIGFKYHVAGGDWLDKSTPGVFVAAGVEFLRKKAVGVGFEIGYDGSEVEFEDGSEFTPGEVLVSLRAIF